MTRPMIRGLPTTMRPPLLRSSRLTALLVLGLLWACVAPAVVRGQQLVRVAEGFVNPVGIVAAGDGSGRLFVVEQRGTVAAWSPDAAPQRWLDLRDRTAARGERGLLGLAFHPRFAENGRVFVHYTDVDGDTTLSELRADPAAATVDVGTETVLFTLAQPYGNHNGGQIAFGPDGHLYLALGDGGSGGDPLNAGQDLGTPLGSLLRFDVDAGGPGELRVPTDNPFVDVAGARPEIWAYGLRNPWRFSFDATTGDLWIADVGQNAVEEVNLQRAGSPGGENYGWRAVEGDRCFEPGCDLAAYVAPVVTYTHASGWGRSITGGVVPYGTAAPSLRGRYLFGDFVSGRVFVVDPDGSTGFVASPLLTAGFGIATFGLDEALDAYVADYGGGGLYRFHDGGDGARPTRTSALRR
jgi:glucose/arabinose dehydrogenase